MAIFPSYTKLKYILKPIPRIPWDKLSIKKRIGGKKTSSMIKPFYVILEKLYETQRRHSLSFYSLLIS
jgi:hypothetical protein